MASNLNFICPTDHIESAVHQYLDGEHYFFTSLGNSVSLDYDVVNRLISLLHEKQISRVNFIISNKNRIVKDAILHQDHKAVRGLHSFYSRIISYLHESQDVYQSNSQFNLLLSYFLNAQMNALIIKLNSLGISNIHVSGLIYDSELSSFSEIYSALICQKKCCLN